MIGRLLLCVLWLAPIAGAGGEASLHVLEAWIREAPPGVTALAGYATLHNTSQKPVGIVKVESPAFGAVEMHRTVIRNGLASMVARKRLDVPAGGELKLAPGGDHFMLLNPHRPLRAGDKVDWLLHLDDGTKLPVTATVRKDGPGDADHSHHNH